jgi:2-polyprenyl-6-methoxyphenol hydroxylase-like FAD-dependent oxidoreductase
MAVGESTAQANLIGTHAVVLGASIAGMAAARVLADHFERVTIIERDRLPAEPVSRTGIPQGRHIHVLLSSGRTILNRLFPGLEEDLARAGAPRQDGANDLAWLTPAGWAVRFPSQYVGHVATRPLLEWAVRQRLTAHPRIGIRDEQVAVGLLASDDRRRVLGVRLRPRERDDKAATEPLAADLTVDATGRGSRAARWLPDLGRAEPPRTEINAFLGYSSRLYRLAAVPARPWQGLYIQPNLPTDLRSGVLMRIENEAWICTLGGYTRDYPPTDEEGFLAFARSLRAPDLADAIADAEPLTSPIANRSSANVWHRYEQLARWPDGFIVLGDAVCAFNPVYGQGMSVAAKEAVLLDACLRAQRGRASGDVTGLTQGFQRQLASTIRPVWSIATSADLQVPGVEGGEVGRADRFLTWYVDRVIALATRDIAARRMLLAVQNLDRSPALLFHPRLVARLARARHGRS